MCATRKGKIKVRIVFFNIITKHDMHLRICHGLTAGICVGAKEGLADGELDGFKVTPLVETSLVEIDDGDTM